jgi:glycosyltransferase involved in cell wall biosynthesis
MHKSVQCMTKTCPIVSIGMPVFNGEKTLRMALDSLLSQTYSNFERIISDNCSTDSTACICREYAEKDNRIRYFRQTSNVGGTENFKFVLEQSTAFYFMWAGSDDTRSLDFLEINYKFLEENADYVASTSPSGFENWNSDRSLVTFAMDGNVYGRYVQFFKNSFLSHGFLYSLFRTNALRESEYFDEIFPGSDWLGFDWTIILCLAGKGRMHRSLTGCTTFGVSGESGSMNIYKKHNKSYIEWWLPFYRFSTIAIHIFRDLPLSQRLALLFWLMRINFKANFDPIRWHVHSFFHRMYRKSIKPIYQKCKNTTT